MVELNAPGAVSTPPSRLLMICREIWNSSRRRGFFDSFAPLSGPAAGAGAPAGFRGTRGPLAKDEPQFLPVVKRLGYKSPRNPQDFPLTTRDPTYSDCAASPLREPGRAIPGRAPGSHSGPRSRFGRQGGPHGAHGLTQAERGRVSAAGPGVPLRCARRWRRPRAAQLGDRRGLLPLSHPNQGEHAEPSGPARRAPDAGRRVQDRRVLRQAGDLPPRAGRHGAGRTPGRRSVRAAARGHVPGLRGGGPLLPADHQAGERDAPPARGFALSAASVLGMALTFTVAGIACAAAGSQVQAVFQQWWVLALFALIFVALAMSMFGLFTLQIPVAIQTRIASLSNRQSAGTFGGVAVMGALSALIVTTCVGPALVGALLVISQSGELARGGAALFAMSIGMGTPLLVVGASAGRLLPKAGPWMELVKKLFGVIMLAVAVWMLARIVPQRVALLLWAVPALVLAALLWAESRARSAGRGLHMAGGLPGPH